MRIYLLKIAIGLFIAITGIFLLNTRHFAQTGEVIADVFPGDANPNQSDTITVAINVDMTGVDPPENKLASYQAALVWNQTILEYIGFIPGDDPWGDPAAVNVPPTPVVTLVLVIETTS